tara:strand:- start:2806 stop:3195 length:390 start_codon:yes stop_codon:yes gene_type:complete
MKKKNDNIGFYTSISDNHHSLNSIVDKQGMKVKLADVIKRELAGRTQAQVAKEAGISSSLLNDWCASRRNPSGKNFPELRKLAMYFGLSMEELIFDLNRKPRMVLCSTRFQDNGIEYVVSIEKNCKGEK